MTILDFGLSIVDMEKIRVLIILATYDADDWTPEGVPAGASGYPLKASDSEKDEPLLEPLSERESGVLRLIAQGLSNREIAVKLGLAEGTIRNYSSRIFSKLHAYDRTQAVIKAARQGIVKL